MRTGLKQLRLWPRGALFRKWWHSFLCRDSKEYTDYMTYNRETRCKVESVQFNSLHFSLAGLQNLKTHVWNSRWIFPPFETGYSTISCEEFTEFRIIRFYFKCLSFEARNVLNVKATFSPLLFVHPVVEVRVQQQLSAWYEGETMCVLQISRQYKQVLAVGDTGNTATSSLFGSHLKHSNR
jgi:hypothetical protein